MEAIRINKAVADAGMCSRRKADALVAAGLVKVNGRVVESLGLRVNPEKDSIEVRGQKIGHSQQEHCYLILNKPISVVSTAHDPEGRTTVLDLVPEQWKNRRLYPAGRLDFFSEGLILLTDDGNLTYKLTHPNREKHLPRIYHVLIRGVVSEKALQIMRQGMCLAEGKLLAPVNVKILAKSPYISKGKHPEDTLLEIILTQGVNRQIRRMCRDLDLTILRLLRIAQGPLYLGNLASGGIRSLRIEEKKALFREVL